MFVYSIVIACGFTEQLDIGTRATYSTFNPLWSIFDRGTMDALPEDKWTPALRDLIKQCLEISPAKRLNAVEVYDKALSYFEAPTLETHAALSGQHQNPHSAALNFQTLESVATLGYIREM